LPCWDRIRKQLGRSNKPIAPCMCARRGDGMKHKV
jgi:hypothetical protein